jgi:D-aminoacyl-tRNA deacylase
MRLLLQRVTSASVTVDSQMIAQIGVGLMILVCAEPNDDAPLVSRLLAKIAKLRIFADENGKMNRSVIEIAGAVLFVPQFTLAANVSSGTRPGLSGAAKPEIAVPLFEQIKLESAQLFSSAGFGQFGADMQVALVNNGPVTIWIEERNEKNN